MQPAGIEPATGGLEIRCGDSPRNDASPIVGKGLAKSTGDDQNTRAANAHKIDPELSAVLNAWPMLSDPIKRAVLALVKLPKE
jgi:hypothetical protein